MAKRYRGRDPYALSMDEQLSEGVNLVNINAKYFMLPPNEDACRIENLVHGRRNYDQERWAWAKRTRDPDHPYDEYRDTPIKDRPIRESWRQGLNDRYALIPIYLEPQWALRSLFYESGKQHAANPMLLWNPDLFQDYVLESKVVLSAVGDCQIAQHNPASKKALRTAIIGLFSGKYYNEQAHAILFPWNKVLEYFVSTCDLIVEWCLSRYDQEPWFWYEHMAKVNATVNITPQLQHIMDRAVGVTRPLPASLFTGKLWPSTPSETGDLAQKLSTGNTPPFITAGPPLKFLPVQEPSHVPVTQPVVQPVTQPVESKPHPASPWIGKLGK